MKKNNAPKVKKQVTPANDDFATLNNELGSFGIEPPKRYRSNQTDKKPVKKETKKPSTAGERKNKQTKKRKRSKLFYKIVSIICVVLAIVAIIVVLSLTVFFKIDTIKISAGEKYTAEQIEAVLPIQKDKNLFLIDKNGATQKLKETLPYVYDVNISRKLPSTVVVSVTETPQVYSVVNADETYTLLDDTFKVLETEVAELPTGTISIPELEITVPAVGEIAVIEDEQKLNNIKAMLGIIDSLSLAEITSVYSVDVNNNYMVYDNRIIFKLGTVDDLENKVYSALTATEKLNSSDPNAEGTMTATNAKQIYFTDK